MVVRTHIYRCDVCGNVIEILNEGKGRLVCCGKPMELVEEKTEEVGKEKHLPVVEKGKNWIRVKVGSIPHPMEKTHYIQWIEIILNNRSYRKFLNPGDKPEAEFRVDDKEIEARAYCNLHGLWKV